MTILKTLVGAAAATLIVTTGTSVLAGDAGIKPIAKSTQGIPVPPVPPGITAIFGPNAALVVGTVGVPGVIVGTVVIAGVVYTIVVPSSPSTTTTTSTI
jgi:hypothetical protein